MTRGQGLTAEDCWSPGGRLQVQLEDEGGAVRLWGNPDGLVGLARLLLWTVQNGMQTGKIIDVAGFGALEPGALTIQIGRAAS